MDSREKMLASSKTLHVAMTRIADRLWLFLDDGKRLERAVDRNHAEKTSALDIYKQQTGQTTKPRDEQEFDGVTRFAHNQESKLDKQDFEKERDYQKELKRELGIDRANEARSRSWDRGM